MNTVPLDGVIRGHRVKVDLNIFKHFVVLLFLKPAFRVKTNLIVVLRLNSIYCFGNLLLFKRKETFLFYFVLTRFSGNLLSFFFIIYLF